MKANRKTTNKSISIIMLLIYLFGSSSVFSLHSHNDHHHHHHHHDVLFCENFYQDSYYDSGCSHDYHIISLQKSCDICDHFSNCEPVILGSATRFNIELFSKNRVLSCVSLYLHDSTNTLNKSPPFIV